MCSLKDTGATIVLLVGLQTEVECALLEGEQESEMAQLQREKELLEQLKEKIPNREKKSHTENSQVDQASLPFILYPL